MPDVIRELTQDERFKWGECSVCQAQHGQPCNPDVGIPLGMTVTGAPPRDGAHLARIQRAPMRVREVPIA